MSNNTANEKLNKHIAQGKKEILVDMAQGLIPTNIKNFEQLHNFVDANEYAGLCEVINDFADIQEMHEFGNAVQSALDAWIKECFTDTKVGA